MPTDGQRPYDLVLAGGRVVDPGSDLDRVTDVAVRDGRIAGVGSSTDRPSRERVDARGLVVLPGLVDLHTHLFAGGSYWGIRPDPVAAVTGVTTWVDAGSAGAFTLGAFAERLRGYRVHSRAFLHIAGHGLAGQTGESVTLLNLDVGATVDAVARHRDLVCGIKVRIDRNAVGPNGLEPLDRALAAAGAVGLPVMVHIGHPPPGAAEVLARLRPGDVLTHCFTGVVDGLVRDGAVHPAARTAYGRGVVFDVGHGSGGFDLEVARTFAREGLWPHVVSTDLHARSLPGPVFDLPHTMAKLRAIGMPTHDVVRAVTATPAGVAGLAGGRGTLAVGAVADLAVFRLEEGPVELSDAHLRRITVTERLVGVGTWVGGVQLPLVALPDEPPPWIARTPAADRALHERGRQLRDRLVEPLVDAADLVEQFPRITPPKGQS